MTEANSTPLATGEPALLPSRRGLLVGAGVLAALGGSGFAWWKNQPSGSSADVAQTVPGFWELQWDMPQGGVLRLQEFRGKPLLINFWATWCPPCIEELPLINDFFRKSKSNDWQVVGLAIDRPDAVQGFLKKMPLDFPVGLAAAAGAELARQLGNPTGSLPFSVALDAQGIVAQRKLGRLRPDDLNAWAQLK